MPSYSPSITFPTNGSFWGKKFYLSPQGLEKVKQEYEKFRKVKGSDIEEGPEFLEARLTEIAYILKNAQIIKRPSKTRQNIIDLGAKVLLEVKGQKQNFEIVGSLEADPSLGKISNESPVGRALLGHKVGDEVPVSASPTIVYKIKKISY